MITIYHNSRCSKSRKALEALTEKGLDVEVKNYLDTPMKKIVLISALELLGDSMIRKNEADYKAFIQGKNLKKEALAELMLQYPKTIERPLVVYNGKMAIGRPLENILEMIK